MTFDATKLYLVKIPKTFQLNEGLLSSLSPAQLSRLSSLSTARQKTYVLGRRLLLYILQKQFPNLAAAWEIIERPDLPPLITHPSAPDGISFSITHSGNWLGLAVRFSHQQQANSLGLDIEIVKPTRGIKAAVYFCNDQQLNDLAGVADGFEQRRQITRLWTQKEAYFKAIQEAVFNPQLKSLSIVGSGAAGSVGYLYSASLDEFSEISVFNRQQSNIDMVSIGIDQCGEFVPVASLSLDWQCRGVQIAKKR